MRHAHSLGYLSLKLAYVVASGQSAIYDRVCQPSARQVFSGHRYSGRPTCNVSSKAGTPLKMAKSWTLFLLMSREIVYPVLELFLEHGITNSRFAETIAVVKHILPATMFVDKRILDHH